MGDMDRIFAGYQLRRAAASAGGGKLFRTRGAVNSRRLAVVLLAAVLAGGCLRLPRALLDAPAGDYMGRSSDPRHAMFVNERVPDQVSVGYVENFGRALPIMPLIQSDLLITVVSGGSIMTATASTGKRYWSRRFNGSIVGHPLRLDNRVIFVTHHRSGSMVALDLSRGRRRWHLEFDGRPATEPAYAEGTVYAPLDNGQLIAVNAEHGTEQWKARIGFLVTQPPLVLGNELAVAARDTLYVLDRATGTVAHRRVLAGAPTAPLAAAGDTLIVATQEGVIVAYAERGAREIWRHDVEAPVLAAPVVADDGIWVLNRRAEVWRLSARTAERVAALGGAATESLTLTADGLLVGMLDGSMTFLRRDGRVVWQEKVPGSVRAPAAVHGGAVYIATLNGRIVQLTSRETTQ